MTGVARYDLNLLRELALLGARIEVVRADGESLSEKGGDAGRRGMPAPIGAVCSSGGAGRRLSQLTQVPRAVRSLYNERGFDLLRVHSFFSSSLQTLWLQRIYKLPVPVVVHFHHLDPNRWRNVVVRAVLKRSDAIITFSEASKQDAVERLGIASEKIHVVYHGIERRFRPGPPDVNLLRDLGCSQEDRILLFLGDLEPRKNPLFLLDILKDLLPAHRNVRLVFCGTGELLHVIRRSAKDMGLAHRVVLTGAIPEGQEVDYYNLSEIFVFPTALEGFGFPIVEAMSCGKPVVAFRASAIPELVEDRVTGFLVSPLEKEQFVRRISLLLEHKELSVQLGTRGRERVDRLFRWERAAKETLNIYQETVKQFRSGR